MITDHSIPLHLEQRRLVTTGQAGDFLDGDQPIRGCLTRLDPNLFAELRQELIGTSQGTGQIGADLDAITGFFIFWMVERVKTNDGSHLGGGDIQDPGDGIDVVPADVTFLASGRGAAGA